MTNPLNAGNKLHSTAVKKGERLSKVRVPSTYITLVRFRSGDGPRKCMYPTSS
jgi:hypothetical protein